MNTNDTRSSRGYRGRRRPQSRDQRQQRESREPRNSAPKKISLWRKVLAFFSGKTKKPDAPPSRADQQRPQTVRSRSGPPERVEVTSPRLYVGNLSYDATETDLEELFNGVGKVQNTEIVTHRETENSKGFGFVTMLTMDEAVRAVETLHDKPFMGRKLVVNGSKPPGSRDAR
jgi:RNA recognition motif-containing protein